jgi:uncharacterized protein (DUF2235 family)
MSGNLQHSLEREQEKRKPQKKKLILCCDGTGYAEITQPNKTLTNVSRIARCINKEDKDGNPQVVYYQPGVGTDSWSPGNLLKQAFGAGS